MFIRQTKKQRSKDAQVFYQFSLVQSTRINGKSRQRTILYLGSEPELCDKKKRKIVLDVLKQKINGEQSMFNEVPARLMQLAKQYYEKYKIKYDGLEEEPTTAPPQQETTTYEQVAAEHVEVSTNKSFGPEHLCMQTLDKLKIGPFLSQLGFQKEDRQRALLAIAARAIYRASECKTTQILEMNSCLKEYVEYRDPITHKQLYRITDMLYNHKEKIDKYLYDHIRDLFQLDDKIVIYDISNTYFETRKDQSNLATYGRSKEKRNDCPLVVFTGVINAAGFIRHSRIYAGNTADDTTLEDMIANMEQYSEKKEKTVVIDAGIATDKNLEMLDKKGYKYVCVSSKRLKDYPSEALEKQVKQLTDRGKGEVDLSIFTPDGYSDTWMLVESKAKKVKEQSMRTKLRARFEEDLRTAQTALHTKGGTKSYDKVCERIGRYKERHNHVSRDYNIKITENKGKATAIKWEIRENKIKEDKAKGRYFIRTNYKNPEEKRLWSVYNTIRRVESTFRCLKTDLNIRPVYHQNDYRIEAHLYLAILAYQLVNTIRYMLAEKGIQYDWRNIVRIMQTQQVQTVELPTPTKTICIRKASKPIKEVKQIYDAARCEDTQKALQKYVVYH